MNENYPPSTPPPTRMSLVGTLFLLPFTLFGVLVGSLLVYITVECLGMALVWPDETTSRSRRIVPASAAQSR